MFHLLEVKADSVGEVFTTLWGSGPDARKLLEAAAKHMRACYPEAEEIDSNELGTAFDFETYADDHEDFLDISSWETFAPGGVVPVGMTLVAFYKNECDDKHEFHVIAPGGKDVE